jgi:hypothetical protein
VLLLQAAGQPVHRTAFTRGSADGNPLFNPFDFQLKNCANTGVLYWGGKLLALYEVRRKFCSADGMSACQLLIIACCSMFYIDYTLSGCVRVP